MKQYRPIAITSARIISMFVITVSIAYVGVAAGIHLIHENFAYTIFGPFGIGLFAAMVGMFYWDWSKSIIN